LILVRRAWMSLAQPKSHDPVLQGLRFAQGVQRKLR
jgi:hypothetical protein